MFGPGLKLGVWLVKEIEYGVLSQKHSVIQPM